MNTPTPPSRALCAAKLRINCATVGMFTTCLVLFLAGIAGCTSPRTAEDLEDIDIAAPEIELPSVADGKLTVVSFNIRYPNRDDGEDYWEHRKHRVAQTLARLEPDVYGVQEAYVYQLRYLREELPGYRYVGVGRNDGKERGETTAIFFDRRRFELRDRGHLWLSDTPDVPGSVGWDAAITRMATWLVLRDRRTEHLWLIVNTHFDHRGSTARTESARLLARFIPEKLSQLPPGTQAVLLGDFNSAIDSAPYAALCTDPEGPQLHDTYRAARLQVERGEGEGTFNGFRGRTDGPRIDWVLTTPGLITDAAGIDRVQVDGRHPSDHDPVWAVLRRE